MLDRILMFAVVIGPTLFAIGVEAMSENVRKHRFWRYGVMGFGLLLSALTWWQISRQEANASITQQNAIGRVASETSQKVSEAVTKTVGEQYQGIVKNLTDQIGALKGQLAEQGKNISGQVSKSETDITNQIGKVIVPPPEDVQRTVIETIAANTTSLLYRIHNSYVSWQGNVAWWRSQQQRMPTSSSGLAHMITSENEEFSKTYERDYREDVLNTRKALLGHIKQLPKAGPFDAPFGSTEVERAYAPLKPYEGINPLEINVQMHDLRRLLHELESDNGLPLTFTDVKLLYDR